MKLSVIIPAYNAAGHLKEAVMSVKSREGYDPKDCQITVIEMTNYAKILRAAIVRGKASHKKEETDV
jgi:hypothetical protein